MFTQKETEEGRLFPHPAAGELQHGLPMIEFLGRIVGKAMYEGILLDYSFSHVFIWKLLGRYIFLDELSTLDPELYQSLIYLKVWLQIYSNPVFFDAMYFHLKFVLLSCCTCLLSSTISL